MPRLLLCFLPVFLSAWPAEALSQATAETTVIVVRHAEKQSNGPDPELNEAGRERARALGALLRDSGVDTVIVSQYRRTCLTAEPLIADADVEVVRVPVGDDGVPAHARQVVERVTTEHAGEVVLVVGHSNTVPAIVEDFGPWSIEALTETDYDRLFIVTHRIDGTSSLIRARYGAPSEANSP